MDILLQAMRAVAEPTRLRILNLCAHSELTVSDLVGLLGQSQPRLSRHLKLLVEGGILERHQEGSWSRYRLADRSDAAPYAAAVLDLIPQEDPVLARDLDRLQRLRDKRDQEAADYFRRNAGEWNTIRALHIDEDAVANAIRRTTANWSIGRFLDIGTGTGKLLELFAPRAEKAVGVDRSQAMLSLARATVERLNIAGTQVRLADMTALPCSDASFDTATIHMVLHYADDPTMALGEAARALSPGGRLLIVDFAEHNLAEMRADHAHRWPGFQTAQMTTWLQDAGFDDVSEERLEGGPLTVCLWTAQRTVAHEGAVA